MSNRFSNMFNQQMLEPNKKLQTFMFKRLEMKFFPALVLSFLLLVLTPCALGQTTVAAGIEGGDYSQLGYIAPLWGVWGNLEQENKLTIFSLSADWSPDHKDSGRVLVAPIAPQYSFTVGAATLLKPWGPILVGGGADYSLTHTDTYTKDGLRWHVEAGLGWAISRDKIRVMYEHIFPGTDRSNDLRGDAIKLRFDVPVGESTAIRFGYHLLWAEFHPSNQPDKNFIHSRAYMVQLGLAWERPWTLF